MIFGFGLGLVVVSLVWLLSAAEPSAADIEQRAKEMGMVYREEILPWQNGSLGTSQLEKEGAVLESGDSLQQSSESAMGMQSEGPTENKEIEPAATNEVDAGLEENGSSKEERFKMIRINPGSSLEEIALQLEELDLIDDSIEFIKVTQELGLSNKIRADFYRIKPGSDYKDILEIITAGVYQKVAQKEISSE